MTAQPASMTGVIVVLGLLAAAGQPAEARYRPAVSCEVADFSMTLRLYMPLSRDRTGSPGEEGMLGASRDAGVLVVGLSTRWHLEGLGPVRLRLARESASPTLLVRRGLRPGGIAPPAALTRFAWSIRV